MRRLWLLTLVVLTSVVVFLLIPYAAPRIVETFDYEGGWVELLSAFFYLVGCIVCLYRILRKTPGDRSYLYIWALLCFMFFGEETSWLQHQIGYGTPDAISEINVQHELNLHNLLDAGSLHDAIKSGKLDYTMFLNTTMAFRLGFFFYFLLAPLLVYTGALRRLAERLKYPLPSMGFVVALFLTLTVSVLGYYFHQDLRMELTEAREMYYAAFIMLYVVFYLGKGGSQENAGPGTESG